MIQSRNVLYIDANALFAKESYTKSYVDHSLYIKQISVYLNIIIVYVDNLIIMNNTMDKMKEVKAMLKSYYDMSDLRELYYCLSMEFIRQKAKQTITMNKNKYIEDELKCFNIEGCKSISTLLDIKDKIFKFTDKAYGGVKVEM